MSSFICRNAPWRAEPTLHYGYLNNGTTHIVKSDTASHSIHHGEASAKKMAERLNYLAALEIMTGEAPNHGAEYRD